MFSREIWYERRKREEAESVSAVFRVRAERREQREQKKVVVLCFPFFLVQSFRPLVHVCWKSVYQWRRSGKKNLFLSLTRIS